MRFVCICTCILAQEFHVFNSYGRRITSRFFSAHRIPASYGIVTISHVLALHENEVSTTVHHDLLCANTEPSNAVIDVKCSYNFTKGIGNHGKSIQYL
jgi:hypothetical protein